MGGRDRLQEWNDVWYSQDGIKWTSATTSAPWTPLHTAVSFAGKIWVITGLDVWSSPDGTSWTHVTRPPWYVPFDGNRGGIRALVCDDKIWAMGGSNIFLGNYNDVWKSPDGETWTLATPHAGWIGRVGHAVVVHDRKMWVLGGYAPGWKGSQGVYLNDVWYSVIPARASSWRMYR